MHVPRDLDCVEIFAGVGSIAAAAAEKGLRSATYDKNRIPGVTEQTEDITTLQGFRGAIALVLRLVSYGLLWLAPDCSSWGFMNSSRCKRSEGNAFVGDVTYSKVIEGNAMAESSVFLILLAAARGVKAALENPGASQFFNYGPVVEMVSALNMVAACTYHCAFSVVPFGKRYKKKYKLLATSSWIRGVFAPCRCPGNLHLPLCNKQVGKNGQVQINGRRGFESPVPTPLLWDNVLSNAHALAKPTRIPLWKWQRAHSVSPLSRRNPSRSGGR